MKRLPIGYHDGPSKRLRESSLHDNDEDEEISNADWRLIMINLLPHGISPYDFIRVRLFF